MYFIHLIKKKIILLLIAFIAANNVIAQAPAAADKTVTTGTNLLAILLVVMSVVLAFVIWGLGQVLVILSRQMLEKSKQAKKSIAILLVGLFVSTQNLWAQNIATTGVVETLPNYGGLSPNTFYMFVAVIVMEIFAILFLAFLIRKVHTELLPEKEEALAKVSSLKLAWSKLDQKLFTKAIPVEKEADILLDHDYDGIKELDNALPPWWKYGFYITIAVAFIYIFNFHVFGNGKNPTEEYVAEVEQAQKDKEIFEANNKDKIDEKNVPTADAAGLAFGKNVFATKCWTCHGKLGEGGAGPNLTDEYWIHKGSLNDVYSTLKTGYPDKGMQSWATDFSPKEMSFIASYVKTLRGTNPPNPKAAQGDLYVEAGAATAPADTTKKPTNDTATVKIVK
jgi:cytochrome c oxidase cbb3-type subunit 3